MSAAEDILIYRTLAAARGEGLPEPRSAALYSSRSEPMVQLHLVSAEDSALWGEWFDRHDVAGWDEATDTEETSPHVHHIRSGTWRGWSVRLVYLTKPEAAEGGEAS